MSKTAAPIPTAEKWDHCVENAIRKSAIGLSLGLLPSALFARSTAARASIVMFSAGLGLGVAYGEARYLFDHDVMFDRRHLINVEVLPPPK